MENRHGHDGEGRPAHRPVRHPSAHRQAGRSVGRQLRADELRRRRRDGRARPRRARLRLRQEVQSPSSRSSPWATSPTRWTPGRVVRRKDGVCSQPGKRSTASAIKPPWTPSPPTSPPRAERREEGAMAPARLGHLPPALLGLPHPHHPLRQLRLGARARRPAAGGAAEDCVPDGSGNPLTSANFLRRAPALLRQTGPSRDRHHGHLRGLRPGTTPATPPNSAPTRWSTTRPTTG